ncbi:F-box/LRR-repeat protein 20-like [Dendronephthya gigantea]|uniref:F-box/LRR-repeat protein 20-like n=1 Tax=Dendronephthya gigantea TaxID=151771 RepID=UPI00106B14C1|nr:F-box/LRR-repeat protein 20-like [Dendronephthya gigantea]
MEIFSLSRLCIQSVADNMAIWCQSALEDDFYKYLYAIGPFNDLNSTLIQELLNILYDKQLLKASYFPLLLHENFTKLDLSRCQSMVTDQVLKLVGRRCKRLTHLNMNGCSRLSTSCLNETLPLLKSLKSLQLSNCRGCTDQLLHNLAKHCHNIQELVINSCPKVTDVGIEGLLTKENPKELGSSDIVHLNVSATSVTRKSLSTILVRLPRLKKLCFADISGGNHPGLAGLNLSILDVEHLDVSSTHFEDSDLKVLFELCPKMTSLRLNFTCHLSKLLLDYLTDLTHLRSLDLSGGTSDDDEFLFKDVEKLLIKRGNQLEYLNLSGMANVRLSVLCKHCRSLKELILAHCENIDPILSELNCLTEDPNDAQSFVGRFSSFCSQLSCIDLNFTTFRDNGQPELSPLWISGILDGHSNLQRLFLKDLQTVNDEVIAQHICGSSSRHVLRTLNLSSCNAITVKSVRDIVEKCRKLQLLDISHCKQIDISSVSKIRMCLKETHRALQVVWV